VPGLGTSFGRGGATNFQQDFQRSDCVWIQGSSLVEAHPVGSRWMMKARERGAKIIHVDPHYSRTSAVADVYVQIRAGSDIAFLGGLIRHIIETESYFRDYVVNYTNAPVIINERYRGPEDLDGLFSGFDPGSGTYDTTTWQPENAERPSASGEREHATQAFDEKTGAGMGVSEVSEDPTLEHPRCVFQILKRHYARYTPEMVERICGCSREDFLRVAETLIENSGRERTSMLAYAVGWTQHSTGVQTIRAGSIIQLLLGNVGRPGGGIMAMRGHASIQGSSDIPTLYDILPGYLRMPRAREQHLALADYIEAGSTKRGWWANFDKYIVSLLKAWFGDAATAQNDYGFPYLPKISGNHSHFPTMLRAVDGGLDGLLVMGQNPAVGSQHSGLQRRALAQLKWLVVRDLADLETASFWRESPEVRSGELRPEDIGTEVFLMPAASHVEKEGHFTNTQRLLQWRDKALEPPGDARSELHFTYHLGKRIKAHYASSERERDWPIRNLTWDYSEHGPHAEPSAEDVLREINGHDLATGELVSSFTELRNDGTTSCGCWLYSGCFADEVNQTRRRNPGDIEAPGGWVSPEWGWAWPANRRVLYNRASADPEGRPWSEHKKYVWWDEQRGRWTGYDVPDFPPNKRPDYRPDDDASGMEGIAGDDPFIMMADGRAQLFAPTGPLDGPLPTYYEPFESPFTNLLYPKIGGNPCGVYWSRPDNPLNVARSEKYPVVASTFRLTEQHTAGAMSRNLPWLAELQPEMFVEINPQLARDRGIEDGGWMTVMTERGEIEARAKVTSRLQPLRMGDDVVHQIAMPWHWGTYRSSEQGVTGDSVNDILPLSGDPNTTIEDKTFSCDVRAGRRRGESTCRLAHEHERVDQMRPTGDHEAELPHKAVHTLSSLYEVPVPADREARELPEGWEAARELARDPGRTG
jgi:formate dehydrogenase major subunit